MKTPSLSSEKEAEQKTKRFQLARLLRCTEQMLEFAQIGDWDSVEELERNRKTDVKNCFSNSNHEDSALVAEALATLIHLNEQVSVLLKDARNKVLEEQKSYSKNKSAVSSYSNC